MNILLINNVASFNSTLSKSLNKIEGVNAKYVITTRNKYISENDASVFLTLQVSKRNPIKYLIHKLTFKRKIRKLIKWCDVLYCLSTNIFDEEDDLKLAKKDNKLIVVEWIGSDIRDPEVLKPINPFYKKAFTTEYEYYKIENSNYKLELADKFKKYNPLVFSCPEMKLFIDENKFPSIKTIFQRMNVYDYNPIYPAASQNRPKIVHCPSAMTAKGSHLIMDVIEKLKLKIDFDFECYTNVPRDVVLQKISEADIFLDQIIVGGYGMASCEAMAMGKPVVCFLLPELYDLGLPNECPIYNCNPENLEERLTSLLQDGDLRNRLGNDSRKFVETYHSSDKIASQMVELFTKYIN